MLATLLFVLLRLSRVMGNASDGSPAASKVVQLTGDTLENVLKQHSLVLVSYCVRDNKECMAFLTEVEQAAVQLEAHQADALIVQVGMESKPDPSVEHQHTINPMLKLFKRQTLIYQYQYQYYTVPLKAAEIVAWILRATASPWTLLETADELQRLEEQKTAVIVGYFPSTPQYSPQLDAFEAAASSAQANPFASSLQAPAVVLTSSSEVAALAGLTTGPGVAAITRHAGEGREVTTYTGDLTSADTLRQWAAGHSLPVVSLSSRDLNLYELSRQFSITCLVLLWASAQDLVPGSALHHMFQNVAATFRGRAHFVVQDSNSDTYGSLPLHLLKQFTPPVVVAESDALYFQMLTPPLQQETLEAFVASLLNSTTPEGGVVTVEAHTFDQLVMDPAKDVLLHVHAPWSNHCRHFMHTLMKLARRFQGVKSMVVGRMDGTVNQHPLINVYGYPTILFKPAGTSKLLDVHDRSLEAILAFIRQHAATPLELTMAGVPGKWGANTEL